MNFLKRLFGPPPERRTTAPVPYTSRPPRPPAQPQSIARTGTSAGGALQLPEATKAAMAGVSTALKQNPINAHMLKFYSSGLARQFSASQKFSARDAWFPSDSRWLQPLGEWVGLLPVTNRECEPNDDAYFAALLGYASSQLPGDIVKPLFVRFFQDQAMDPDDERRGQHTVNVLCSMAGKLPHLEGLFADDLKFDDGGPLHAFAELRVLSIARCMAVADFAFLRNLKPVEVLRLDSTGIADLSPLVDLTQLKTLSLVGCKRITNASLVPLADAHQSGKLPNLRKIHLQRTGVLELSESDLNSGDPDPIFRAMSAKI